MISLLVYGLSMIILFTASSLFHGVMLPEARRNWLRRFDHAAIFLLIAGTYTPIIYNLFPLRYRWTVLIGIWLIGLVGILVKLFSHRVYGSFKIAIYPVMAWAGVVPALLVYQIKPVAPLSGLALLLLGGLVFMAGFVVYHWHRPNPWPGVFGHHEIWHFSVIGGCFFHYIFMLHYVVPA
jgi:hemolysin III